MRTRFSQIKELKRQIEILELQKKVLQLTHDNPYAFLISSNKESLEKAIEFIISKRKKQ